MAEATWRDDDEALFQRSADRARLAALWASEHAPGPPPHPRASGMIALLRRTLAGEAAAARLDEGDPSALAALTRPTTFAALDPRLVHHLALHHERLARQRIQLTDWQRALGAWRSLAEHPTYLRELADAVAGDSLPDPAKASWAQAAGWRAFEGLIAEAEQGAPDRSDLARVALQVLAAPAVIATYAGVDPAGVAGRAERARARILDAALAPIDETLDEAEGRPAGVDHVQALEAVVDVWRWAGRPDHVERFFVDRALDIGWQLYTAKSFMTLKRLLGSARPLLRRFAERVRQDPREVAHASRVAQFMVFEAEMEPRLPQQIAAAETAVALCDTHRNGRLVLADLLAERALRSLEEAPILARRKTVERAAADVKRARVLWPDSSGRIDQAAREVVRRGGSLDG